MQLVFKDIDLKTSWIKPGKESFLYYEKVDSTLNIALDEYHQEHSVGKIVISDNQIFGKGTYNKSWYSESCKDLTFSIILGTLHHFTQQLIDDTCTEIVNVLQKQKINAHHKKPNDIYVKDRKIAGILLSNVHSGNNILYQALSLGININSNIDLKNLDSKAKANHTSFVKELGVEISREKILVEIIQSIDIAIQKQVDL